MSWGTVTVGGIPFRETIDLVEDFSGIRIAGQEAHPPLLRAEVEAAHLNIAAMKEALNSDPAGLIVPVVFTDKPQFTGFYRLQEATSGFMRYANGAVETTTWAMTLTRIGSSRDVEIESKVNLFARPDEIAGTQTAVVWHAPAIDTTSYFTGPTSPASTITRPGEDGVITVYTGLPTDTPRWTIRADDYMRGAARLTFDTMRSIGTLTPPTALWSMVNGLVQVTPGAAGTLIVTCFDNATYRSAATFAFTINGTPLGVQPELVILRNDPEEVAVRLTYPVPAAGRVTVDLALRRGSRFVTGTFKRASAAVLGINETGAAAAGTVTGGVRQTTADADGNRFVLGSSRNATLDGPGGGLTYTSTALDFFLGHEVGPGVAGDLYADLFAQYLGSSGERVRVVRR